MRSAHESETIENISAIVQTLRGVNALRGLLPQHEKMISRMVSRLSLWAHEEAFVDRCEEFSFWIKRHTVREIVYDDHDPTRIIQAGPYKGVVAKRLWRYVAVEKQFCGPAVYSPEPEFPCK